MVSGSFAECTFGCGFTHLGANLHQRGPLRSGTTLGAILARVDPGVNA